MGTGSAGLAAAFAIFSLTVAAAFSTAVGRAARRAPGRVPQRSCTVELVLGAAHGLGGRRR
jgi:hypothetical protein